MKHAKAFTMLASAVLLLSLASSPALADSSSSKDKKEVQYPNATRVAPKLDLSSDKDQKNINAGLDAVAAHDKAKATQYLQPIIDGGSKSKYAQALALQGMANVKYDDGDNKGAIDLLQRSLANGVMPNDTYFQLLYELAQFQLADQQYQASLDTLTKWRAEGKKETAESYGLEGDLDYQLQKYPEAIAAIKKAQSMTSKPDPAWNQIVMASYSASGQDDKAGALAQQQLSANPDDPAALDIAVQGFVQQQQYPQAIELLEKARAKGTLKNEGEYVNLASLYFNRGQSSDNAKADASKAVEVLEEGMSKGVVTPSAEHYTLLGEAQELSGSDSKAAEAFNKAIPMAKDGEPAVQYASLLNTESNYSQAKVMAQQGIDKGVKRKGVAYMVLAESERGLKNKAAEIAALKQAAQYPETADRANAELKKVGGGK